MWLDWLIAIYCTKITAAAMPALSPANLPLLRADKAINLTKTFIKTEGILGLSFVEGKCGMRVAVVSRKQKARTNKS